VFTVAAGVVIYLIQLKATNHISLSIDFTYAHTLYRFGRRIGRDDYPDFRLAVAQGTLLWQPVKFGGCSQISAGMTFTLRFGVRLWIGRS